MPAKFRIDLHCHCQEHSACSNFPAESIVAAALDFGLDAIAFTNHDSFMDPDLLEGLRSKFPSLKIYNCAEISLGIEHLLYIGPFDPNIVHWNYDYESLWRRVRRNSGFLALAHPFRFTPGLELPVDQFPPHAIEIHSTNTGRDDEEAIAKLAKRIGAKIICNSDGHAPKHIGIYRNVIEAEALPKDEAALAACLKSSIIGSEADTARIAQHNAWVEKLEILAKQCIESGKGPLEFESISGEWRGFYDRVKMGRSYKI